MQTAAPLFSAQEAAGAKPAPFLPTSRAEMESLGWDRCDVIVVTGDAYVDHPSFGMAIIGRVLEAHGFKVGIIAQPDWRGTQDFEVLGAPRLFFGVTGGNMDSMVNRYTSDRRVRSDDAYTPGGRGGQRPDRSVIVYSQRLREAFKSTPIVIGGIEASLRRIAHFDYWSEHVRRSILVDSKADLLVYGNAERQIGAIARRLRDGCAIEEITDLRGTAFLRRGVPADWVEIDSTELDTPGPLAPPVDPYAGEEARKQAANGPVTAEAAGATVVKFHRKVPNAPGRRGARRSGDGGCQGREILPQGTQCAARAQRGPAALVRTGECGRGAVRPCVAHPAPGSQSGQRAGTGAASWRVGRLAQSTAHSAGDGRHGCGL